MPGYQHDEALNAEDLAKRKHLIATFAHNVSSTTFLPDTQRYGILNMDVPGRKFHDWQIVGCNSLLKINSKVRYDDRKACRLFSHDMGSGKTILTMACLGSLWHYQPNTAEFRALLIVPASLVKKWYQTILGGEDPGWTNLTEDDVYCPSKASDVSMEKLQRAKVVLLSPGIILSAYKSFHWLNKEAIQWTAKNGNPQTKAGIVRGYDPSDEAAHAKYAGSMPPTHPLYAFHEREDDKKHWTLVAIDEAHQHSSIDDTHWHSLAIQEFTKRATYCVALTGTPVQHHVKEMPGLCRLLDVPNPWMHSKRFWSTPKASSKTLRKSTSKSFFEKFTDRVSTEDMLRINPDALVPETTHRVLLDPFIGRLPDGTYEPNAIEMHNAFLQRAHTENAQNQHLPTQRSSTQLWSAWHTMAHMAFNVVLGTHAAKAFKEDPNLQMQALAKPSQSQILLHRLVRSRQVAGHPRVAVFSKSVADLMILRDFLKAQGDAGTVTLFDGRVPTNKRQALLDWFLSKQNPKGVFLFSDAGAQAIDLCPGCEVLIIAGEFPWSSEV